MAHYAFLDENNIVFEVIVGIDENDLIEGLSPEIWYSNFRNVKCVRTSYNGKIRKNYAGIGYFYDSNRDAFIAPKPYDSWILNESNCQWEAPFEYPNDGNKYQWDESQMNWQKIEA